MQKIVGRKRREKRGKENRKHKVSLNEKQKKAGGGGGWETK